MRKDFVHTANSRRFLEGIQRLGQRGAEEACLMVVDGAPGYGKSETVQWYASQTGSAYIRSKKEWSAHWMLKDLLESIGVPPERGFRSMFEQALAHLSQNAIVADGQGGEFAVVIDEVDHIVRRGQLLETIRDLSDFLEIPFILVGMGQVRSSLKRFPQVASRVSQYVEFQPAPVEDVAQLVKGHCRYSVGDDLVAYLARWSHGRMREVKEGIASIERFGSRNKVDVITCELMQGQVLMNDRMTGQPILVRGG